MARNNPRRKQASRRQLLSHLAAGTMAVTVVPRHVLGGPGFIAPSERVRMAGIGVAFTTIAAPKNVMLAIAAAKTIASAELPVAQVVVVAIVFLIVASIAVGGPVIGYLVVPDLVREPLVILRRWFAQNAATVMTVVLVILGVNLIGKGLGNF